VLFDWFTVFAQIANFLILMWLLKRFLYKPVLNVIDAREKRITGLLNEATANQQQVEQQQLALSKKYTELAVQQESLMLEAQHEADNIKQEMLRVASNETQLQRQKWLENLRKEKDNLDQNISMRTKQAVFNVVRKVLQDLSSVALETQITLVFIEQLQQLRQLQRQPFLNNEHASFVITSAMELSDENKQLLEEAIKRILCTRLPLQFVTNNSLVSGIELMGNGHKLSWNIDAYLCSLEQSIAHVVDTKVENETSLDKRQAELKVDVKIDSQGEPSV
jgi:F-type H+-transporting ATPase subunit b